MRAQSCRGCLGDCDKVSSGLFHPKARQLRYSYISSHHFRAASGSGRRILEFLVCLVLEEQTTVSRESPQAKRCKWWHLKVELVRADMASREWGTSNICAMMLFYPRHTTSILVEVRNGVFMREESERPRNFLILKVWQPIYSKKTKDHLVNGFMNRCTIGLRKIWVWFPFQPMNLIRVSHSLSSGP